MRIEAYFQEIRRDIEACSILLLSNVAYDKRGTYKGFIRGDLLFSDNSTLHLREFINARLDIERLMYAYQYMDADGNLIFRYDNSGHHRELSLLTYPHHKHNGNQDNIIPSSAPSLHDILVEIENI